MIRINIYYNSFDVLSQDESDEPVLAAMARQVLMEKNPRLVHAEKMSRVMGWTVPSYLPRYLMAATPVSNCPGVMGYTGVPLGLLRKVLRSISTRVVYVHDSTGRYKDLSQETMSVFEKIPQKLNILREYQQASVNSLVQNKRGLLVAMTGSGKTMTMSGAIKHFSFPTIILCHRLMLIPQWEKALKIVTGKAPSTLASGTLTCGDKDSNVLIASFKSLANATDYNEAIVLSKPVPDLITGQKVASLPIPPPLIKSKHKEGLRDLGFGDENMKSPQSMVVVDEAHVAPTFSYYNIVSSLGASVVYGCSATPNRTDGQVLMLEGLFSERKVMVGKSSVSQHLAEISLLKVNVEGYLFPDSVDKLNNFSFHNSEFYKELLAEPGRFSAVINVLRVLASKGLTSAVVCGNHLWLIEALQMNLDSMGIKNASIIGETKAAARAKILEDTIKKENKVILATTTLDEGVDIPNLDAILFPTPFESSVTIIQRAGRVVRSAHGKQVAFVIDFVDNKIRGLERSSKKRTKTIIETFSVRSHYIIGDVNIQTDLPKIIDLETTKLTKESILCQQNGTKG